MEVKNRILGLIQTWGLLFRGKHGLGYVCDTYMILQHEGFQFPPKDNVGAALVESEAVCLKAHQAVDVLLRNRGASWIVMLIINFYAYSLSLSLISPQIGQILTCALGAARLLR